MTDGLSLLDSIKSHCGPVWDGRVESRHGVLPLVRSAGGCGMDFILFLTDEQLNVLDVWRLPREPGPHQGFPTAPALRLAVTAKAAGMIVVQEREDPVPRRPDMELTSWLGKVLEETGTDLLDHLLISGDAVSVCRPK